MKKTNTPDNEPLFPKEVRKKLNYSIIAEKCGVSYEYTMRIITGRRRVHSLKSKKVKETAEKFLRTIEEL